jgi:hypothetical protein
MNRTIEVKITGNTSELERALRRAHIAAQQLTRNVQAFNDAWERSLRRQRRLRFASAWWRKPRLWWWRAWYRLVDWRRQRGAVA